MTPFMSTFQGEDTGASRYARAMARTPWIAILALAGCGAREEAPYPEYAPTKQSALGSKGFQKMVEAARQAEVAAYPYRTYVSFTATDRSKVVAALGPALSELRSALEGPIEFGFSPREPFTAAPNQVGWRMLGRVLSWRIEDEYKAGEYDSALRDLLLATQFGWALTQGGATDASLGFEVLNDARERIAPSIDSLTAAQLKSLAAGLDELLSKDLRISACLDHEHDNMLAAIQYIQDRYRKNSLAEILAALGPDARAAVKHLGELRQRPDGERLKYFEGLRAEADAEFKWQTEQGELPAAKRESNGPKWSGDRPWQTFAKHFFTAGNRLLPAFDAALARTRLLAVHVALRIRVLAGGKAPSSLSELNPALIQDPYSGGPFVYRADGSNFKVYSVGPNFQDDGGQTDTRFERPDLTLERS